MPPRQFRIGDRVRIRAENPSRGLGNPRLLDETGIIQRVQNNTLYINFPSHSGWMGEPSDLRLVEQVGQVEQSDAADEATYQCDWCNTEVPEDEIIEDSEGTGICEPCRDGAIRCENCGQWTTEWCRCRDYCPDCHNEFCNSGYVHDYHASHHRPRHFLPNERQDLYLGIELEMEAPKGDIDEVAKALYPLSKDESIFLMETDASLDNGLEIVSEPATLTYHKTDFGWDKITSVAKDNHAISHDSGNCGIHIHFNLNFFGISEKAQELNSAKLLYFFERFWKPLVKFSRRTARQLECTAQQYGSHLNRASPKDSCDSAKSYGRYYAVNLSNDYTIEIRIFRGTLELETFYARLELVDFLARYVKKRNIHYIQRTTWTKVVKAIKAKGYPNLIKYLEGKELLKCAL